MEEKLKYLKDNTVEILDRIKQVEGIDKYLSILKELEKGDISKNYKFQKNYSSFFRLRRNEEWKEKYFDELEKRRRDKPNSHSIKELLEEWMDKFPNVEFSFGTKLNHVLSPNDRYIYDSKVGKYLNILHTSQYNKKAKEEKIKECIEMYERLQQFYKEIIESDVTHTLIKKFDQKFGAKAKGISKSKKIDFFLWKQ